MGSKRRWHWIQACSIAGFVGLCAALVAVPAGALFVFWRLIVPLLPLLFFVAPGLWRNICPLAAANQLPRRFGFSRAIQPPRLIRERGPLVAMTCFLVIVPSRKVLFNSNGPALAALLALVILSAFFGGVTYSGKSGWCSSLCPLLPVQRLYGQHPLVTIRNSHCEPCLGCAKNCYDLNPQTAHRMDLADPDPLWRGARELFAGAFPGVVLAFYRLPSPPAVSIPVMYVRFFVMVLLSVATFAALEARTPLRRSQLSTLYAAVALTMFYWFNIPLLADAVRRLNGLQVPSAVGPLRGALALLTVTWLARAWLSDRRAAEGGAVAAALATTPVPVGLRPALSTGLPRVTFQPTGDVVALRSEATLLEAAELAGVPIEAGCRMGVCGADPISVLEGAENLSPVTADEAATIARMRFGPGTRLACSAQVRGAVCVAAGAGISPAQTASRPIETPVDESIRSVVIIGNGIAGITAAGVVRRRHPHCEIHLIGREPFPLYNRMGISRLIYGRSALQGLYLMTDDWYDENRITTWLNTSVRSVDRRRRLVQLATGQQIAWDRLILAMGARASTPPMAGFGMNGSFVLRSADDAIAVRRYAQEHASATAVVAGGGLLGLEAAHALHSFGLETTVLERSPRLLANQLDERASHLLARHLERTGIAVVCGASVRELRGEAAVQSLVTEGGAEYPADVFLVCAGITPGAELARQAGLEVQRGIVVDDGMRTSDPHIFAAGDVAEFDGHVPGLWPVAVAQAEVAAANAMGDDEVYVASSPVAMLKGVGLDICSAGRVAPEPDDELVVVEEGSTSYRKLVVSAGRVSGAIVLGTPADARRAVAALRDGRDVTRHLARLRTGDWTVLDRTPEPPPAPGPPTGADEEEDFASLVLRLAPPPRPAHRLFR